MRLAGKRKAKICEGGRHRLDARAAAAAELVRETQEAFRSRCSLRDRADPDYLLK
jgi:hypothetical protein